VLYADEPTTGMVLPQNGFDANGISDYQLKISSSLVAR
jgi:hypothetical protein